jgi:3-methyladenine DNA glycosylase AlkD
MQSYIIEVRQFIDANSSATPHTQAQTAYSGSTHIHHSINAPTLRAFVADFHKRHKTTLNDTTITELLDALYHGDSFEERAIAGILLARLHNYRRTISLDKLDSWLDQLVGWAEIDSTCQSTFTAKEVLPRWDEWARFLRKLAKDKNVNKRRASIVLLLKTLGDSDDQRVYDLMVEQVERLKGEKDTLITKAISWILRDAIKNHREAVAAYVEANRDLLPKIAVREFTTKFISGRKSG